MNTGTRMKFNEPHTHECRGILSPSNSLDKEFDNKYEFSLRDELARCIFSSLRANSRAYLSIKSLRELSMNSHFYVCLRRRRLGEQMAPGIRTFFVLLVALGGAASTSVEEAIQASLFASFAV